jgi:lipopolysaccharide transport system permease protein
MKDSNVMAHGDEPRGRARTTPVSAANDRVRVGLVEPSRDDAAKQKPWMVIEPRSGWSELNLTELWRYRDLLVTLAIRDVKLRYKQTALGVIWVILQPLLAAGIFTFVFGKVARMPSDGLPYFAFSYAGLLAWNAFNSTLTKASASVIGNSQLVSRVFFPRLILPLSTVLSTLIDFFVALALMVVLMVGYGITPGWGVLLLPLWLILLVALALGIGVYTSALTVRYRDLQYVVPVLLQMLLYASPVAYSVSAVPDRLRVLYFLNPMSGLLEAFRWSLLGRGQLDWTHVIYSSSWVVVVSFGGALAFKKMEHKFADVI